MILLSVNPWLKSPWRIIAIHEQFSYWCELFVDNYRCRYWAMNDWLGTREGAD